MPVLVDSNIILDIFTMDAQWVSWSTDCISRYLETDSLCINPIIYGEVSARFTQMEALDAALPGEIFRREALPFEAAFLAGKCFLDYRRRGGARASTLPDFFIGAHAAVRGWKLLTRDGRRYREYFPTVELIAP